uniref:hypothetical protein n=1 Tax=Methylobacterium sp. B34 TaxID=95563 RepID=UPI000FE13EEF|nr:hypothetical protein [Methylobacterium sp. B34]
MIGQSHILINTGFVVLLDKMCDELLIVAHSSHMDSIEPYLANEALTSTYRLIRYQKKRDLRTVFNEITFDTVHDQLLFLNCEFDFLLYLNFWARRFHKPRVWVLHSHFLTLAQKSPAACIKNFIKNIVLFSLSKNNKYIVCGIRIPQNLSILLNHRHLKSIYPVIHPIGRVMIGRSRPLGRSYERKERLSVIYYKGWQGLTSEHSALIADLDRDLVGHPVFSFSIIVPSCSCSNGSRFLSIDYRDRINEISTADFFLHLPSNDYSLQASGALMDMLISKTPVIGLRTDFASSVIDLIGPFGYFFDSIEELYAFVMNSDEEDLRDSIPRFRKNLSDGAEKILGLAESQLRRVLFPIS